MRGIVTWINLETINGASIKGITLGRMLLVVFCILLCAFYLSRPFQPYTKDTI
jgi:ABC-type tungstate transport system substrate-binding protein